MVTALSGARLPHDHEGAAGLDFASLRAALAAGHAGALPLVLLDGE